MTRPRVLEVLGPSTGGIRRHVRYLTDHLRSNGWSVTVAGPRGVLDDVDHPISSLGTRPGPGLLGARHQLRDAMAGADLVHAHGLTVGWLCSTVRTRPPLVVSVHNLVLDEAAGRAAPALRRLEGRLPSRVTATIAISDEVARRFRGRPGSERIHVIPPAGPSPAPTRSRAETRAALGVGPGEDLIVTAARLHPQKGLDVLLDAASRLVVSRPQVRWFVFGDGPQRTTLEREVARRGLDGTVVLAGSRPDVDSELAAADVVAISSHWESGPLVVLEAVALGRPVVSTDVGLAGDVLGRSTGVVVPVGDAAALADAIASVLAAPAADAPLPMQERWQPAALASRVEDLYAQLLGDRPRPDDPPTVPR